MKQKFDSWNPEIKYSNVTLWPFLSRSLTFEKGAPGFYGHKAPSTPWMCRMEGVGTTLLVV